MASKYNLKWWVREIRGNADFVRCLNTEKWVWGPRGMEPVRRGSVTTMIEFVEYGTKPSIGLIKTWWEAFQMARASINIGRNNERLRLREDALATKEPE